MALAATDNVVDTLQMHVSKHACYELFVNYSGVDGLTREFTKVGLVVGDPVFANNLSGGCDCVLCSKTVGCGFCVWDEEFEIGRKGGGTIVFDLGCHVCSKCVLLCCLRICGFHNVGQLLQIFFRTSSGMGFNGKMVPDNSNVTALYQRGWRCIRSCRTHAGRYSDP